MGTRGVCPTPTTWGFPQSSVTQLSGEERGRRRGRSGARLRRAAPGRPRATRGAEPGLPGREPLCRGSERRAGPRDRNRGDATARKIYNADVNDYPEPATTTPPTNVSTPWPSSPSLPPWMLSYDGPATSRRAAGDFDLPVC
jgi:hypothetical protein